MAIIFPDPSPTGPTSLSNVKEEYIKVVKLTFSDFTTGGVAAVKAVLPADATMTGIGAWARTQLSGGGMVTATMSIGTPASPTFFINAASVGGIASGGSSAMISTINNLMQPYNVPLGGDIILLFSTASTGGNPTAGELYVTIRYVR